MLSYFLELQAAHKRRHPHGSNPFWSAAEAMQIKTVEVKNLRAVKNASFTAMPLTAFIGENNVGKSTLLKALELFFDPSPRIEPQDFSVGSEDLRVEITIAFSNLTPDEVSEFGTAVVEGQLIVTRHFSLTEADTGQYSVQARVFAGFEAIRAEANGTTKRTLYNAIANEFDDLEPVKSHTEVEDQLLKWEEQNIDQLSVKRVRGFFGAINVANGKLRKKTSVHLLSAIRDVASDATDQRRSPIISLLIEISRRIFENRREMSEFISRAQQEFDELSDPTRIPALSRISEILTNCVQRYYSDSKLTAQWDQGEGVQVSYPSPRLVIDHSGVVTDLSRVGHGLQRAALFSIVQFLAEQIYAEETPGEEKEFDNPVSDIIILIEEPEIYQHPSKQLAIYDAFRDIVKGYNRSTGIRVQIIYTTHSEKFVHMRDFDIARIVRRYDEAVRKNLISGLTIGECSEAFAGFFEPAKVPMSDEAFISKMHIFSREVCEGFFANKVVLVEGVTDRAVLETVFGKRGRSIHGESIAIISVEGKTKMDKPAFIFRSLGISTYLVFDNDINKSEGERNCQTNILLQKICNVEEPEEWPEGCFINFTAIGNNLETYLQMQLEDQYDEIFSDVAQEFELNYNEIKKTPAAIAKVLQRGLELGKEFPLFDEIIEKIDAM